MIDKIKKELKRDAGEYESFIDSVPILLEYLVECKKATESRTTKDWLNKAISYVVAPANVLPKETYGPYHYVEVLYVFLLVLLPLMAECGKENEFEKKFEIHFQKVNEILTEKEKSTIRQYAGLFE